MDIEKEDIQLPPGYKRLEYIERVPEKLYSLSFVSLEDAKKRMNELNAIRNDSCSMMQEGEWHIKNVRLIFPQSSLEYLTETERSKVKPFTFPTQFVSPIPILCRFMEEQYIDQFLKEGKLRLSTFVKCKSLEDSIRKDDCEGRSLICGTEGKYSCQMDVGVGSDAFLLCTSLKDSYTDSTGNKCDCYLEIFDIQGLAIQIAQYLSKNGYNVSQVLFGSCTYTENKQFSGTLPQNTLSEIIGETDKSSGLDFDKIFNMPGQVRDITQQFFQKPIEKSIENEYRVLWLVEPKPKEDYIDVVINDPENYARKIIK